MSFLYLAPIGDVALQILAWIESAAADWFPFPTRRLPALPLPAGAYEPARLQYRSVEMLKLDFSLPLAPGVLWPAARRSPAARADR